MHAVNKESQDGTPLISPPKLIVRHRTDDSSSPTVPASYWQELESVNKNNNYQHQGKSIIPFSDQLIGILQQYNFHPDRGPGHPSTLLYIN